jgi:hypothetical protein
MMWSLIEHNFNSHFNITNIYKISPESSETDFIYRIRWMYLVEKTLRLHLIMYLFVLYGSQNKHYDYFLKDH